jgi:hypothetical protein
LLKHALTREDERGKEKGHGGDGAPFIGNAAGVGDGLRAAPHGSEAWRGGVEPARRSGDTVVPKQGRAGADRWAPATVLGGGI